MSMRSMSGAEIRLSIAVDLFRRAMAAAARIARVAAGTGIHGGDQLESCREFAGAFQPRRRPRFRFPGVRVTLRAHCAETREVHRETTRPGARATVRRAAVRRRRSAQPLTPCVGGCETAGGPPSTGLRPAADSRLATSRTSGADNGGSKPGNRCASSVLPAPGGPIISSPCSPAAAISKARLAAILAAHLGEIRSRSACVVGNDRGVRRHRMAGAGAAELRETRGAASECSDDFGQMSCKRSFAPLSRLASSALAAGKIISLPNFAPAISAGNSLGVSRNAPPNDNSP